jgi:hypothetical protein
MTWKLASMLASAQGGYAATRGSDAADRDDGALGR